MASDGMKWVKKRQNDPRWNTIKKKQKKNGPGSQKNV